MDLHEAAAVALLKADKANVGTEGLHANAASKKTDRDGSHLCHLALCRPCHLALYRLGLHRLRAATCGPKAGQWPNEWR